MSLKAFDLEEDISQDHIENKLAYEITTLSAAQVANINTFVAENSSSAFFSNAQGTGTTTPLSSAVKHYANYYFSSTGGDSIPVASNTNATSSIFRSVQVGRTTMDDGVVSGTVTAVMAFGTSANNTYIDVPEETVTGSVGRKGSLVVQSDTANIVGTVFYDSGTLVFHGGSGHPHNLFMTDSSSGFTFGSASAAKVVCTQLSFRSLNVLKRTSFYCRALNKQFNYTNNPTALSDITNGTITASLTSNPSTYITTVSLYNDDGEMLAVAKISPPVKKSFTSERIFEVRLDY